MKICDMMGLSLAAMWESVLVGVWICALKAMRDKPLSDVDARGQFRTHKWHEPMAHSGHTHSSKLM